MEVLLLPLFILFVLSWMVGFWLCAGTIRAIRESGHRYWMINPFAVVAGFRALNFRLYLAACGVGAVSLLLIVAICILTGRI
jgi:hypothetical protein